jgi:hypothetical protein
MFNYFEDLQARFEKVSAEVEEWYRTDMDFKKLVDTAAQALADQDEEARRGR